MGESWGTVAWIASQAVLQALVMAFPGTLFVYREMLPKDFGSGLSRIIFVLLTPALVFVRWVVPCCAVVPHTRRADGTVSWETWNARSC